MQLVIATTPQPKERPRFRVHRGHPIAYTPARTAKAEAELRAAVQGQLPDGFIPYSGALRVRVVARVPRPKTVRREHPTSKPDVDNYLKLACDALNGVVWTDDSIIVDARIVKAYAEQPGWIITVEEVA